MGEVKYGLVFIEFVDFELCLEFLVVIDCVILICECEMVEINVMMIGGIFLFEFSIVLWLDEWGKSVGVVIVGWLLGELWCVYLELEESYVMFKEM